MRKQEKRLSNFLIKRFIMFIVSLLIMITLFMNFFLINNRFYQDVLSTIFAENLIHADYESIDTAFLEDLDGWIEILDSDNRIIYTKGKVGEVKEVYTQSELLEQASFKLTSKPRGINIAGLIQINPINPENEIQSYLASYTTFTRNGEEYVGIVKIPSDKIDVNYTVMSPKGVLGEIVKQYIFLFLLGLMVIISVSIYYYSKNIEQHLAKPNKALVDGLEAVTLGEYTTRLKFEAEYEYKEIQHSFNYLTAKLQQAEEQRNRYDQEREQLFANLAHDLKTPITTIQGYSRALMDNVISDENKKLNYIKTINDKTHHLTDLINRLLTYTKLNRPEYELKLKRTDYGEFIRRIIADSFNEIEQYNRELELNIPNEPIFVMIDELEMQRVINNLLNNAIKHNPPQTTIFISLKLEDNLTILEVADNGIPVPIKLQSQLFEPFICGDESRNTKNGSGLGLSICQKIIQKHNGQLQFNQVNNHYKYFRVIIKKATSN